MFPLNLNELIIENKSTKQRICNADDGLITNEIAAIKIIMPVIFLIVFPIKNKKRMPTIKLMPIDDRIGNNPTANRVPGSNLNLNSISLVLIISTKIQSMDRMMNIKKGIKKSELNFGCKKLASVK